MQTVARWTAALGTAPIAYAPTPRGRSMAGGGQRSDVGGAAVRSERR